MLPGQLNYDFGENTVIGLNVKYLNFQWIGLVICQQCVNLVIHVVTMNISSFFAFLWVWWWNECRVAPVIGNDALLGTNMTGPPLKAPKTFESCMVSQQVWQSVFECKANCTLGVPVSLKVNLRFSDSYHHMRNSLFKFTAMTYPRSNSTTPCWTCHPLLAKHQPTNCYFTANITNISIMFTPCRGFDVLDDMLSLMFPTFPLGQLTLYININQS